MKKVLGIVLCMVLILAAAVPTLVSAEGREYDTIEDGKLNIVIDGGLEKVEAKPGDIVDVKIKFVNNSTISSAKITIAFDSKLSVVTTGEGEPAVAFNIYTEKDDSSVQKWATLYPEDNKLLLNWLDAVSEVTGDAVYATISFKVSEDAEDGAFLPITAEIDPDDVYDIDVTNTAFKLINGGIDIVVPVVTVEETEPEETEPEGGETEPEGGETEPEETEPEGGETEPEGGETEPEGGETEPEGGETEPEGGETEPEGGETEPEDTEPVETIPGDINGDGEVNNKDVVVLFRYVSGTEKEEDETKYDYNGDGEVNNKDVVALFRAVSSAT